MIQQQRSYTIANNLTINKLLQRSITNKHEPQREAKVGTLSWDWKYNEIKF